MDEKPNIVNSNNSVGIVDDAFRNMSVSCCSGSCSESSYSAKWENYIRADGTVFYVEYGSHTTSSSVEDQRQLLKEKFTKIKSGKHNSNKLSKLIRRRNQADLTCSFGNQETKEIHSQINAGCHTSFPQLSTEDALVLILCCIFDDYTAPYEGHVLANQLMQYLRCYHSRISSPLQETIKIELVQICRVLERRINKFARNDQFEKLFNEPKLLPMPREAKMRIFDAISEMNAMDYRDWNEQPLTSHRHFFIYGCSFYYKSFLLASNLPPAQLGKIELFLRLRGILDFIEERDVFDLVLWEEIPVTVSDSKFFLAITGRNKLLLVVILQLFGTKTGTSDHLGFKRMEEASLFYVDEMQGTLDHLHQGGIDVLSETLVNLNAKPNMLKCGRAPTRTANLTDYLSIRKNCIFSPEKTISLIPGSSLHSLTHSEESNQKGIEDDSDSDWDYHQGHQKFLAELDMLEIKGSCFKDVNIMPSSIAPRIKRKENVLIHYIYQDIENSIIISSCQITMGSILSVFRRACQYICEMLQSCKPNRKTFVVMKEYGVLTSTEEAAEDLHFWTIGIFFIRFKRRLYICNGSNILQSALEVALRLSFY